MENHSKYDNYFTFFNLNPVFRINLSDLKKSYFSIQKEVHPDRHVLSDDIKKKQSTQRSITANIAYQTLLQPISRGFYLCSLHNAYPENNINTTLYNEFLIEQIKKRQILEEEKNNIKKLRKLYQDNLIIQSSLILEIESILDIDKDYKTAIQKLKILLFIEKFIKDLKIIILDKDELIAN